MLNTTNPFKNKKLAFIKDGIVQDILIVDPNDLTIEQTLVELKQSDFAIEVDDNDYQAKIDGHYIDGKFYDIKHYPSWIRNDEHRNWEAPIPYPNDGKRYQWNEDMLNWEERLPLTD